jgi:hypothetical protein
MVAVAILGAGAVGAAANAYGSYEASKTQANAAQNAANLQMAMYGQTRSDLAPYRGYGQQAGDVLMSRLNELTSPIVMDQATLEKTPGYQFNLTQGLKAVQNSAAARGLGSSGAALKGASTFATGLADSTYQQQFANAVTNQTNAYNRLKGLVDLGETAAAGTGQAGTNAANGASNALIQQGNAQAAGTMGIANSFGNLANAAGGYALYKGLFSNNSPQMNAATSNGTYWG